MYGKLIKRAYRLYRNERGSYLIEFAAISLPLSVMLMGGIEIGYLAYSKSHTEGVLREVARMGSTGSVDADYIKEYTKKQLSSIANASIDIDIKSYSSFNNVAKPEPIVSDVEPFGGEPSAGDCYTDINGNGQWDADRGASGTGQAGDIVFYGVTVTYPVLFPLTASAFGRSDNMTIESNTIFKNEPFGSNAPPPPSKECIL